jgi:predicted nucleic acid-binding protein
MEKLILDTSILIAYWKRACANNKIVTSENAQAWAKELIKAYKTDAIVTPIYVEFLAGVQSGEQLRLSQAFLNPFRCVDERRILPQDWDEAIRLAQRIPRGGKPRHLGDCLIRAIANRLRYGVKTDDSGFPK